MSEQENIDNIDTSHARNTQPLSVEERQRRQKQFLKTFRESGNIKHSCKVARISRTTFYNWRDQDEKFQVALAEAEKDADDTLEFAAYERAVKGVPSHVISQGKMVYGPNKKPLIERKYSDGLLTTLLKARLPEKYKDRQESKIQVAGDVAVYLPQKQTLAQQGGQGNGNT